MIIPFLHNFPAELRLVGDNDAEMLFRLIERNRRHLRQWLPWLDANTSIDYTRSFVRQSQEQFSNKRGFQTAIWFDNAIAGIIGYHPIDWQNRAAMIGYWLGEEFQSKGIMTAACQALVNHAINELKLHRVEIRCATGNTRSCAIPERLRFTREGVIKDGEWLYDHFVDLVLYRMLDREWKEVQ